MTSSPIRSYLSELSQATRHSWDRFWFTPRSPETLGAIRVCTGLMLVYTHLVWGIDLLGFFGPNGRLPTEFALLMHQGPSPWQEQTFAWSHLYGVESAAALISLHILALILLVAYTLGVWTRITSILAFLITVSYAHRGVGALFGLDQINGMLAMYTAIGPSGAVYSIDAWRRSRAGGRRGRQPLDSISANIAIRLIQCHMCVIYMFAGFGKLLGSSWWDGTALWGAFANLEYQTLDMTWLVSYPRVVNFLTQTILVWEITYCVLVWPRITRPLVLLLAVPLHLGIAVCMGMITFGLIMLVGNAAFIPSATTRAVIRRLTRMPSAHETTAKVG